MTLYQKVIAVVGMLRASINQRASKLDLAPLFNSEDSYAVGRMVVYNDVLYRCTTAHSGNWDAEHFTTCTIDEIISLFENAVAPDFDTSTAYTVGFIVYKDGKLMQCTTAGTGNSAVFTETTLNDLAKIYTLRIAPASSTGSEDDRSVTLQDGTLTVLDYTGVSFDSYEEVELHVTLPTVSASAGSKIVDALLRVDVGSLSTRFYININQDDPYYILSADDEWYSIKESDSTTIFTFTYAGTKNGAPVWLVGKITRDIS